MEFFNNTTSFPMTDMFDLCNITFEEYISVLQNEFSTLTIKDYIYISLFSLLLVYILFSRKKHDSGCDKYERRLKDATECMKDAVQCTQKLNMRVANLCNTRLNQIKIQLSIKEQQLQIENVKVETDENVKVETNENVKVEAEPDIVIEDVWEIYSIKGLKGKTMKLWCPLPKMDGEVCGHYVGYAIFKNGDFDTFTCKEQFKRYTGVKIARDSSELTFEHKNMLAKKMNDLFRKQINDPRHQHRKQQRSVRYSTPV